ncbi:MAG TPA: DinB family protein, partial [Verrucomicrobiae bacterium]|nr:DinB family protein [Verrucomicrobiae bacterium]
MSTMVEPKLAAPGAGLPGPELMIARFLFKKRLRSGTRESFVAHFQKERQQIAAIVAATPFEQAGRRVLIERVRGLEDSSRFWSVWMTLEHLRIVHERMTTTVECLAKRVMPAGKVRTADVKPDAHVGADVVDEYERSCEKLLSAFAAIPDLKTELRFEHPWFGPLDAFGWLALAAGHMSI